MSWKSILKMKDWQSKFDWTRQPRKTATGRYSKVIRGNGPECAEAGREYMVHEVLEHLWLDPAQRIRKQFYEGAPAAAFMDLMETMIDNPERVHNNFKEFPMGLLEQEVEGARQVLLDFDECWKSSTRSIIDGSDTTFPPVVTEADAMASSLEFPIEQAERILDEKAKNPNKDITEIINPNTQKKRRRKEKKRWNKRGQRKR
jgi:hypothetical protein